MTSEESQVLLHALDRYFAAFESTRALASALVRERKYPTEILILLGTRLDALASEAAADGTATKKAFSRFVVAYGGERNLFRSVSVGDLYYELAYHRWLLEGTIPMPGRLHRFTHIDTPFIQLLEEAGLPLTFDDSAALVDTLLRILKQQFHVMARQPRAKPHLALVPQLKEAITEGFRRSRLRSIADDLPNALEPLLGNKIVSTILYERFRCEPVHGASVHVDEARFFREGGVYWRSLRSEYYGPFELIEFSAEFLLTLLDRCIRTYRSHLLRLGKLPPDVHFHAFPNDVFANLDLLDETLLPEGGKVAFKLG